jgi:Dolichyl-phosphate-mannose-protein mannosyltransferase
MDKPQIKNALIPFFFLCAVVARVLFPRHSMLASIFAADYSVSALTAKHISEFKEFPIFSPLSHYGGTFLNYTGALLFKIFGVSPAAWNAVGIIASCTWILLSFTLAKKLLSRAGHLAALVFVCLPPWNVLFFSLFPGVYAETLVAGTWFLLLLIRYHESINSNRNLAAAIGFVAGFGLWLTPYMALFILTAITIALMRRDRKRPANELLLFLLGFCVGYLPAIIYNLQHPGAQIFRFGGRILNLDRSVLSSHNIYAVIFKQILWRISTIPQSLFQIPGMVISLFGLFPAIVFASGIILTSRSLSAKRIETNGTLSALSINAFGIFFIFIAWFIIFYSILIGDSATRYMFPLAVIAPFFIGVLGQAIRKKSKMFFGVFIALIAISGAVSIRKGLAERKMPAYPEFAAWLTQKGIHQAYADPWTAYCVQLESHERVLLSPTLTHPAFYDRWPSQTELVRKAAETVFIVNEKSYPEITGTLEKNLRKLQISYRKESFREFAVYVDFSRKVYPEELTGFGNPIASGKRD